MSTTAFMTTAFARVGFAGDYGGSYFLTRLVGAARARELNFLSERIEADRALALGLANWLAEPNELESRASELSRRLAAGPAIAYRYMKESLNRAVSGGIEECLDLEATHHIHCSMTEDHKEAARAFMEKREPVFKGR